MCENNNCIATRQKFIDSTSKVDICLQPTVIANVDGGDYPNTLGKLTTSVISIPLI